MNDPSRRAALAALSAAFVAAPRRGAAQTVTTLTLAGVPEDSITPVLYAQSSGLFRKYGLDVHVQSERSGPAITSGVLGGAYQIGKASITPLIQAHSKNVPIVLIAPAGIYDANAPIDGFFVRADSAYKTAPDLNGKAIGVYGIGDIHTISVKTWMAKNGGDPSSVKPVEIPISAMVAAIEQGRVDAGSMNEPALQLAVSAPQLRMLAHAFAAVAPRFMYTAWFASTAWASANPTVVANFARAVREAAVYVNGHHDQTVDLISAFTSVDPAVIRKMTRVVAGTTLDPALIAPVIDAMVRTKDIPSAFDARELIV